MPGSSRWSGLGVRAGVGWLDWLRRLAKHSGTSTADVVDRALAAFAASVNFEPPPVRNPHRPAARSAPENRPR